MCINMILYQPLVWTPFSIKKRSEVLLLSQLLHTPFDIIFITANQQALNMASR